MGSMQWQLGREMGTTPAFASRTQENQENLCRDGRSYVEMAGHMSRWPVICRDGRNRQDIFVVIYFHSSPRTSQRTHCIHYKNQPYECT